MNKILLVGRNTKDIELRYTNSQVAVAQFSLAVNRNFKNQNGEYDADFINCVAYKKLAETISAYVKKGDKLGVEGRLQTRTYDNSEGKKVYVSEVIVENIEFLEPKKQDNTPKETKEQNEVVNDPFADFQNEVVLNDEDLPW